MFERWGAEFESREIGKIDNILRTLLSGIQTVFFWISKAKINIMPRN